MTAAAHRTHHHQQQSWAHTHHQQRQPWAHTHHQQQQPWAQVNWPSCQSISGLLSYYASWCHHQWWNAVEILLLVHQNLLAEAAKPLTPISRLETQCGKQPTLDCRSFKLTPTPKQTLDCRSGAKPLTPTPNQHLTAEAARSRWLLPRTNTWLQKRREAADSYPEPTLDCRSGAKPLTRNTSDFCNLRPLASDESAITHVLRGTQSEEHKKIMLRINIKNQHFSWPGRATGNGTANYMIFVCLIFRNAPIWFYKINMFLAKPIQAKPWVKIEFTFSLNTITVHRKPLGTGESLRCSLNFPLSTTFSICRILRFHNSKFVRSCTRVWPINSLGASHYATRKECRSGQ